MTLDLNYEGFENNLIARGNIFGGDGVQYLFRFENHYGASVVKDDVLSYGHEKDLWELAVIKYYGDRIDQWHLNYSTDITDDVIGYLTDEGVREILKRISDLKEV